MEMNPGSSYKPKSSFCKALKDCFFYMNSMTVFFIGHVRRIKLASGLLFISLVREAGMNIKHRLYFYQECKMLYLSLSVKGVRLLSQE
jgi:hypothetical protein